MSTIKPVSLPSPMPSRPEPFFNAAGLISIVGLISCAYFGYGWCAAMGQLRQARGGPGASAGTQRLQAEFAKADLACEPADIRPFRHDLDGLKRQIRQTRGRVKSAGQIPFSEGGAAGVGDEAGTGGATSKKHKVFEEAGPDVEIP